MASHTAHDLRDGAADALAAASPDTPARRLLDQIRSMLLQPDERNAGAFADLVDVAMATVAGPTDTGEAYIGSRFADTGWLADFDELTSAGVDQYRAMTEAMRALRGQMRWHATTSVHNVNAPVLLPVAATHAVTTLFNPNALWDLISGGCLDMERRIVGQLGTLVGWNRADTDGLFTFGGKAGFLYAIRLGLARCLPDSARLGLGSGARPVVLTTDQNHYSIRSACALLGVGLDSVVNVPTVDGRMSPAAFRRVADDLLAQGRPLATVVLCGANTLDAIIDPIEAISDEIDELVDRHHLPYRPWVHLDLPLGWPWLFFRDYDFRANPLGLSPAGAAAAEQVAARLVAAARSDSTCFDLHKLGLSPYSNSVFLTRHLPELRRVFGDSASDEPWREQGANFRQHHSIEHSRSAAPIVAAWTALRVMGKDGFRAYLAHLHDLTAEVRSALAEAGMVLANPDSPSLASMFVPTPPGVAPAPAKLATAAQVEAQNLYTEALFRYVCGLADNVSAPVPLGFVPRYWTVAPGLALSAMRIYLANPLLDHADVRAVVARVVELKQDFDRASAAGLSTLPSRLTQTPK